MTALQRYDVLVVGGGTAALAAATGARKAGARVAMVADGPLGGDCTFTGCVPSKSLIEMAAKGAAYAEAHRHLRDAVERIARTESAQVMRRALRIDVVESRATFVGPRTVEVDDGSRRRLEGGTVVIATGSAPVVPAVPGLREADPLTNETVFDLEEAPESLAVLGGGAIGCELAQAFARFGTRVVVVEAADRLLGKEEPEAGQDVLEALQEDGVEVRLGAALERVDRDGDGLVLHLESGDPVRAERLLVAVGRRPTPPPGVEDAGVELDERGAVVTDDTLRTTAEGTWAAGDCTSRLPFTHAAYAMGSLVVRNAMRSGVLGRRPLERFDTSAVPWVTFTSPEVGRVGLTEAEAAAQGPARVAWLPMREVDRAVVAGEERGFVKLVAGPRTVGGRTVPGPAGWLGGGQLLGATVVAPRAGEMVHEAAIAMRSNAFTGRLAQTVHAYPTWSVAVQQAAAQFFGTYAGRTYRDARA